MCAESYQLLGGESTREIPGSSQPTGVLPIIDGGPPVTGTVVSGGGKRFRTLRAAFHDWPETTTSTSRGESDLQQHRHERMDVTQQQVPSPRGFHLRQAAENTLDGVKQTVRDSLAAWTDPTQRVAMIEELMGVMLGGIPSDEDIAKGSIQYQDARDLLMQLGYGFLRKMYMHQQTPPEGVDRNLLTRQRLKMKIAEIRDQRIGRHADIAGEHRSHLQNVKDMLVLYAAKVPAAHKKVRASIDSAIDTHILDMTTNAALKAFVSFLDTLIKSPIILGRIGIGIAAVVSLLGVIAVEELEELAMPVVSSAVLHAIGEERLSRIISALPENNHNPTQESPTYLKDFHTRAQKAGMEMRAILNEMNAQTSTEQQGDSGNPKPATSGGALPAFPPPPPELAKYVENLVKASTQGGNPLRRT